jgi:hypothetical protein
VSTADPAVRPQLGEELLAPLAEPRGQGHETGAGVRLRLPDAGLPDLVRDFPRKDVGVVQSAELILHPLQEGDQLFAPRDESDHRLQEVPETLALNPGRELSPHARRELEQQLAGGRAVGRLRGWILQVQPERVPSQPGIESLVQRCEQAADLAPELRVRLPLARPEPADQPRGADPVARAEPLARLGQPCEMDLEVPTRAGGFGQSIVAPRPAESMSAASPHLSIRRRRPHP